MDKNKIIETLDILSGTKFLGLITPSDVITSEIVDILKNYSKQYVEKIFPSTDVKERTTFCVEVKCRKCNKTELVYMSKTKLLNLIYSKEESEKHICDECKKKIMEEEVQWRKQRDIIEKQKQKIETANYIQEYLTPSYSMSYPKISALYVSENYYGAEGVKLIEHANRSLSYKDFLRTPYWKGISNYKKYKADNKCQLCGGTDRLEVHHRDYSIRGREIDNLNGLICLCHNCHEKFHNKVA